MSNQTSLLQWVLAALCAAGCSTTGDSEVAAPTDVAAPVAAPGTMSGPALPAECTADKECMRTDCCGVGDGCAPAPRGQVCSDSLCVKSVWSVCRCETSRCTGVFWDTTSDKPRPKEFEGW